MKLKSVLVLVLLPLLGAGVPCEEADVWSLAPRTELSRDFDVKPFLQLPPERAEALNRILKTPYIVFDFETTGTDPKTAKIVEIAALRFIGTRLVGKFHTLVNPGEKLHPEVTRVNGLTDAMLQGAPSQKEALTRFMQFSQGCELVGHYISRFDIPLLENSLARCGLLYKKRPSSTDTKSWAQKLIPRQCIGRYHLSQVARFFSAPQMPAHRALADAVTGTWVFWGLRERERKSRDDFIRKLQDDGNEIIGKTRVIAEFLKGDYVHSAQIPRGSLLVWIGTNKMRGAREIGWLYGKRFCKKILIIAQGRISTREGLMGIAEDGRQHLIKKEVRAEDIQVEESRFRLEDKLEYVLTHLQNLKFKPPSVVIMGDFFYMREMQEMWRALLARKRIILTIPVQFLPNSDAGSSMRTLPLTLWKLTTRMISAVETLQFESREGWIPPIVIPENVQSAVRFLMEQLGFIQSAPAPSLEDSV